jgi:hypothetical protein
MHRRLLRIARELDITLIRRDAFVTPVEARNLAWPHVQTELVAFVDNDTEILSGWHEPLERCLRDTGAAIVMPVVLECSRRDRRIHYAGGVCHIETNGDKAHLVDHNPYIGKPLELLGSIERAPTENVELHCALARADVVREMGQFDEALVAVRDDADLALRLQVAGHEAWIEPDVIVVYPFPKRFRAGDRTFFRTRWSDEWTEPGFVHFNEKWRVHDEGIDDVFRRGHMERRMRAARWPRPTGASRLRIWRWRRRAARALDRVVTPLMVRRAEHRRATAPPARVAHRASWDREAASTS